ncbi:hypothetical protein [Paenibacillus sp. OV219]|uniref:hypothetical protein n=1 Tax=Paenibacillus sp. OV219 TaxID=1884377 RepID=UPI0008C6D030|nr:hypothetical protein [Paenibacillus sp. OV219]SEO60622.1 hypothetical protein SAMN05518847_1097 [Paenibacillus sp. OV219]
MAVLRSKRRRKILLLAVAVLLIVYYLFHISGYSLSARGALRHSFPPSDGAPLYIKSFGDYSVGITGEGKQQTAKLIYKKWGFLYQVRSSAALYNPGDKEPMGITWLAHLANEREYNVLLAAKVENPAIHIVRFSHEGDLADSYIEVKVENGYAVTYQRLPIAKAGNFVFRGLNDEGKVLAEVKA